MRTIIKTISTILDSELNNLNYILPNIEGWADAIGDKPNSNFIPARSKPTVRDYVYRRLGHMIANPHNQELVDAVVSSYVFSEENVINEVVINRSKDSAEIFMNMLIELALNEQDKGDLYIGETERRMEGSPEKIKCLIGPKGCGKTFFLNYLFSKFSPILDSKGVIWVRLNLLEEFGDDKDILHRIYAQATKIIMRYYDPESAEFKQKKIPIPAGQSLQLYIERSKFPAQHKKGLLDEVEGMRDVFYTKKREEPLSPALVSKSLGRKVFNLARDNGYSYIIVFYGLDRMEATSQHDKRFRSLVNQVANLALNASVGARALWPPSRRLPCSHLQPDLADRGRSC